MKYLIKRILRNSFVQIFTGIFFVMVIGGAIIGQLEGVQEITRGINPFWWAIVTMTTVGYGDLTPVTNAGRLFAIVVMFFGISFTALLTATISSIFVAKRIREDKGLEKVDTTHHIIICGWNKNAERIIDSLQILNEEKRLDIVLVNDLNEDSIAWLKSKYRHLKLKIVRGDFTRESILERANVKKASTAVILSNESLEDKASPDEKTIFGTLTIKTLAPNVRVIACITERENLTHIKRANADEVIIIDDFAAYLVASHVMDPGVPQTIEGLLDSRSKSRFNRVDIPQEFVGKPYQELFDHYRDNHGWVLVGIFSEAEQIGIGDILTSDTSALDEFIERKLMEAGHSLREESKIDVVINPEKEFIIKENHKAIIIQ